MRTQPITPRQADQNAPLRLRLKVDREQFGLLVLLAVVILGDRLSAGGADHASTLSGVRALFTIPFNP